MSQVRRRRVEDRKVGGPDLLPQGEQLVDPRVHGIAGDRAAAAALLLLHAPERKRDFHPAAEDFRARDAR